MLKDIKNFLLTCSGANRDILDDDRCKIEQGKYVSIGLTVLFTAILASISGTFAFDTVFKSIPTALLAGLFWGFLIFNLDRYIVSSLRKKYIDPNASARTRAALKTSELTRAAPRFLLALFISIIITKPLELHLFGREIDAKLSKMGSDQMVALFKDTEREFANIPRLTDEIQALKQETAAKEQRANELFQLAMQEAIGISGKDTTGKRGKGIVYAERMADYEKAAALWREVKQRNELKIAEHEQALSELRGRQEERNKEIATTIDKSGGLLARLEALQALGEEKPTVWWANLFLILLFIMLETSPIIVKLFSDRGPYDDVYEAREHEVFAEQQKKISEITDRVNSEMAISRQINKDRVQTEVELHRRAVESIYSIASEEVRAAQREVLQSLIAEWRHVTLAQLNEELRRTNRNNGGMPTEHHEERPPEQEPAAPPPNLA